MDGNNQNEKCNQEFKSLMDGKMHICKRTDERHRRFRTPHMATTETGHIIFSPIVKGVRYGEVIKGY